MISEETKSLLAGSKRSFIHIHFRFRRGTSIIATPRLASAKEHDSHPRTHRIHHVRDVASRHHTGCGRLLPIPPITNAVRDLRSFTARRDRSCASDDHARAIRATLIRFDHADPHPQFYFAGEDVAHYQQDVRACMQPCCKSNGANRGEEARKPNAKHLGIQALLRRGRALREEVAAAVAVAAGDDCQS